MTCAHCKMTTKKVVFVAGDDYCGECGPKAMWTKAFTMFGLALFVFVGGMLFVNGTP
jgi:hypothetical protein